MLAWNLLHAQPQGFNFTVKIDCQKIHSVLEHDMCIQNPHLNWLSYQKYHVMMLKEIGAWFNHIQDQFFPLDCAQPHLNMVFWVKVREICYLTRVTM